jgi:mono/diheme cytochrome c family protein
MENRKFPGGTSARLTAFLLLAGSALSTAFAQAPIARMNIPFSFSFGGKTLPAGYYSFKTNQIGLIAQSDSGEISNEIIITWINGPGELLRQGALVFEKSDSNPILSEIWLPGMNGILVHSIPKDHGHTLLLANALSESLPVSGKTAYSYTCARCHGSDGKGEPSADRFFNTKIPKLASAEVQGKSDEELRTIIAKGTKDMPPVEIDEAGFRHRLPPQDVDAVIAYIRIMKK